MPLAVGGCTCKKMQRLARNHVFFHVQNLVFLLPLQLYSSLVTYSDLFPVFLVSSFPNLCRLLLFPFSKALPLGNFGGEPKAAVSEGSNERRSYGRSLAAVR